MTALEEEGTFWGSAVVFRLDGSGEHVTLHIYPDLQWLEYYGV